MIDMMLSLAIMACALMLACALFAVFAPFVIIRFVLLAVKKIVCAAIILLRWIVSYSFA